MPPSAVPRNWNTRNLPTQSFPHSSYKQTSSSNSTIADTVFFFLFKNISSWNTTVAKTFQVITRKKKTSIESEICITKKYLARETYLNAPVSSDNVSSYFDTKTYLVCGNLLELNSSWRRKYENSVHIQGLVEFKIISAYHDKKLTGLSARNPDLL